ncbi:uncharacterized protein DS421_19g643390 [Arachis hypogaea]|uniref:Uncharacterized protein n=1 Tax=Arachis hypogaea TaxID=3818 RepID=A0A6B9V4K2_ARAHY|nr:uncharacterized protein DS421_19g643390 [Arachis hypogaea]
MAEPNPNLLITNHSTLSNTTPKLPAPSLPFLPPSPTIHQGQQRHRPPSSRDQNPERSSVATQQRSSVATCHPAALVISHRNHCTAAATTTALRLPPRRRTSTSSPSSPLIRR